jgi:hypothetical protein
MPEDWDSALHLHYDVPEGPDNCGIAIRLSDEIIALHTSRPMYTLQFNSIHHMLRYLILGEMVSRNKHMCSPA